MSSLQQFPCDKGIPGGGRGWHHFQAVRGGGPCCVFCGKEPQTDPNVPMTGTGRAVAAGWEIPREPPYPPLAFGDSRFKDPGHG